MKHPGQFQDVARAFAWVKANAGRQGGRSFLIVYGEGETAERHELSKEFRDALKKAGGEAEVLEVDDRTHQELFAKIGDGDPTTEAALSFIVQHSER